MKRRKLGRPAGSKNVTRIATAIATRCPQCSSTDREEYAYRRVELISGTAPDGKPFNRVVRRRTRCEGCGLARIDTIFEFTTPNNRVSLLIPSGGSKKAFPTIMAGAIFGGMKTFDVDNPSLIFGMPAMFNGREFAAAGVVGGTRDDDGVPVHLDAMGLDIDDAAKAVMVGVREGLVEVVGQVGAVEFRADGVVAVAGKLINDSMAAGEVGANAINGFPWTLALSLVPTSVDVVRAGHAAVVNGRPVAGPCCIIRRSSVTRVEFRSICVDGLQMVGLLKTQQQINFPAVSLEVVSGD